MSSSRRSYRNDPDKSCTTVGNIPSKKQKKAITDFVRKICLAYFKVRHIVCKACVESLRKWANGTLKSLSLV